MLLSLHVRYLDSRDKQFKGRVLWLDTDTLDPVTKAAVEATREIASSSGREMLRYRHLFEEKDCAREDGEAPDTIASFIIDGYFEDEEGKELSEERMGTIVTGRANSVMFPAGAKQYQIDFALADKPLVDIDKTSLSEQDVKVIAYFCRDVRELAESEFLKEGPGTYSQGPPSLTGVETSVSAEEIRSFVTIFRRLYMKKDRGNLLNALDVFAKAIPEHPVSAWAKGIADEYARELTVSPMVPPGVKRPVPSFWSRKRLLDIFIYTQYSHQPDDRRIKQFQECLELVRGNRAFLEWSFFFELWSTSWRILDAGRTITEFYKHYCRCHGKPKDVLDSLHRQNPGIGLKEKKGEKRDRILLEKAEELSVKMWQDRGQPEGSPTQFLDEAREQLRAAIEGDGVV
jgi:hypothetical protein